VSISVPTPPASPPQQRRDFGRWHITIRSDAYGASNADFRVDTADFGPGVLVGTLLLDGASAGELLEIFARGTL
jgi:hypothetical protein